MKCTECEIDYPSELVQPMMISTTDGVCYADVCGICALEISNQVHGIHRKRFTGKAAERLRKAAIKFREGSIKL